MKPLDGRLWFNLLSRLWRPLQQWGFAIAAVSYAFRPVLDYSFSVETFAALAAASGFGFTTRAVEKMVKTHSVAKHASHKLPVDTPLGGV